MVMFILGDRVQNFEARSNDHKPKILDSLKTKARSVWSQKRDTDHEVHHRNRYVTTPHPHPPLVFRCFCSVRFLTHPPHFPCVRVDRHHRRRPGPPPPPKTRTATEDPDHRRRRRPGPPPPPKTLELSHREDSETADREQFSFRFPQGFQRQYSPLVSSSRL